MAVSLLVTYLPRAHSGPKPVDWELDNVSNSTLGFLISFAFFCLCVIFSVKAQKSTKTKDDDP